MGGRDGVARWCPKCGAKKMSFVNMAIGPQPLWVCSDCAKVVRKERQQGGKPKR